jgi:hypothetical protein
VIERRAFISGITFGLIAAPLAAEGQPTKTSARIGLYLRAPFLTQEPA